MKLRAGEAEVKHTTVGRDEDGLWCNGCLTYMQIKVPNKAPINPTRSLKNGIASAMRNEMTQLNRTHELSDQPLFWGMDKGRVMAIGNGTYNQTR